VNEWRLTATVTNIARRSQLTTECRRESFAEHERKPGFTRGWEEPARWGCHLGGERYTTLRVELEDGEKADFWIEEKECGKTGFARVLAAEPGERLTLSGLIRHREWRPSLRTTRVRGASR
jgi:hypothetical protein